MFSLPPVLPVVRFDFGLSRFDWVELTPELSCFALPLAGGSHHKTISITPNFHDDVAFQAAGILGDMPFYTSDESVREIGGEYPDAYFIFAKNQPTVDLYVYVLMTSVVRGENPFQIGIG